VKVRRDGTPEVTAAGTPHDCVWPPKDRLVGEPRGVSTPKAGATRHSPPRASATTWLRGHGFWILSSVLYL